MIEYRTKTYKNFRQPDIVVSLDEQSGLDIAWLIDFFEQSVAQGKRYKHGETVQIGWILVLLKNEIPGELSVWEPDFDSNPVKWIRGVNNTIRQLVLQKSVADLLKVNPAFPSLRQSGLASKSYLELSNLSEFQISREASAGNDSGWRFNTLKRLDKVSECRSLYELALHQMMIVPFLALPTGVLIIKNKNDITLELGQKKIYSVQNPLLQKIAQLQIWI